jgi:drug/metabolite transporter (DMT)-like permease
VNQPLAIVLAIAAAAVFAVSSVLQQRGARETPKGDSMSWRIIRDLLSKPVWLAGVSCVVVAFGLQASALAFAPVAVVEPLIAVELVLALPLAARLRKRRLGVREWAGALAVAGGVAIFLAVSSPTGGDPEPSLARWAVIGAPVLLAAAVVVAISRRPTGPKRAMLLAVASGLAFALMALITQSFVTLLRVRGIGVFASWQPYVLACIGAVGFTVVQSAYQAGPLALSLPIVDSLEPLGSVILAAFIFSQHLSTKPVDLVIEGLAALAAVVGLALLGRSPLVLSIYEQDRDTMLERTKHQQGPSNEEKPYKSATRGSTASPTSAT